MKTSMVILTYNNLEYTKQCIDSIRKYTEYGTYEIIVVDNASLDGTVEWLKEQEDIKKVFNNENQGFPKGCNQGIEISTGENILLLNNDVIVTVNWLSNMIKCLYSSEDIGAVGAVSNSVAYCQQVSVNYNNLYGLNRFAEKYNISDPSKWEERIRLIGFCMLIKKKVLDEVGLLDERFSHENFEDDDLSLRIREKGYKNVLCKDTFIHHYGGASFGKSDKYNSLIDINEEKFYEKWKFRIQETTAMNYNLISRIKEDENKEFSVLDIGCGCGANLLAIKNKYKNVKLFGVDKNEYALEQAKIIAQTCTCDAESFQFSFDENKFDYIIMDNILNLLCKPEKFLRKIKSYLKADGKLIISVANAMNYRFIYSILYGGKLYKNNLTFNVIYDKPTTLFNYNELSSVLLNCDYKSLDFNRVVSDFASGDEAFINKLCELFGKDKKEQYMTYEYIVVACNNQNINKLDRVIKSIEEEETFKDVSGDIINLIKNLNVTCEDIIKSVNEISNNKIEVLNYVASIMLLNEFYEYIIPLLQRAFEINPKDKDTIYNIGYVLHLFKNDELAMKYLDMLEVKNEETVNLVNEIKSNMNKFDENEVKFLLRRIENNIEVEQSKNKVVEMMLNGILNCDSIIKIVSKDIIKKDVILDEIAILCYKNKLYEEVIPLLQKSYEINNANIDTIYNIGYMLHKFGQDEIALKYLSLKEDEDIEIKKLIQIIRGDINE